MNPEFAYFAKVNMAFVLFYAFYSLFFSKDTFFKLRRTLLLLFFGLALLYPLFNIQEWVKEQEPIANVIDMYSTVILPETTVYAISPSTNWRSILFDCATGIYVAGIIFLTIRFFVQLISILRLAYTCHKTVIHGVTVRLLDRSTGPFSFFRLIFLCPENFSDKETDEILMHECTHVSQWHSIDVIISEIIAIFCWFNPFIWLLRREVRHNLEYLADNKVIQAGYDSKSYQYHLLGLAHNSQVASDLYNNFNVIHLKNRIIMMNKRRTHGMGRTKYLVFLPLAGILMLLNNIEAVACVTAKLASEATAIVNEIKTVKIAASVVNEMRKPLIGASVIVNGTTIGTITGEKGLFLLDAPENGVVSISYKGFKTREIEVGRIGKNMEIQLMQESDYSEEQYFTVVDKMPKFPGGDAALLDFLANAVKYPKEAFDKNITGRVICSFIVDEEGNIHHPKIVKGIDSLLDAEALRVIKTFPKWNPGTQRGKAVPVKYTVPIMFSIKGEKDQSPTETEEVFDPGNVVFSVVEQMPKFPGGDEALLKYIATNVKYPKEAETQKLQGRVVVSFIVEKDGAITNVEVAKKIDPLLDAEAIRVIKAFPKWKPGMQRGKFVRVMYTVPISFHLQ